MEAHSDIHCCFWVAPTDQLTSYTRTGGSSFSPVLVLPCLELLQGRSRRQPGSGRPGGRDEPALPRAGQAPPSRGQPTARPAPVCRAARSASAHCTAVGQSVVCKAAGPSGARVADGPSGACAPSPKSSSPHVKPPRQPSPAAAGAWL